MAIEVEFGKMPLASIGGEAVRKREGELDS
jgi:hypothetical protein